MSKLAKLEALATAVARPNGYISDWEAFHTAANPATILELVALLTQAREAMYGLSFGEDWNKGTHAKIYRPKLIESLAAIDAWGKE